MLLAAGFVCSLMRQRMASEKDLTDLRLALRMVSIRVCVHMPAATDFPPVQRLCRGDVLTRYYTRSK